MTKETDFELHPQLAADCEIVGDLVLNQVLLMRDANYPWLILVPRRAGLRELYDLDAGDLALFYTESCAVGQAMMRLFGGYKLNVAALGNAVPQLHAHHIVRFEDDGAWPGPVWGVQPARAYEPHVLSERLGQLRAMLAEL